MTTVLKNPPVEPLTDQKAGQEPSLPPKTGIKPSIQPAIQPRVPLVGVPVHRSRKKQIERIKHTATHIKARIRHSVLTGAPLWLSRGALSAQTPSRVPVELHRAVMLPEMPDVLNGLKITHLSDLHIGKLTTPDHLPTIMSVCQKMQGDLIAVTGDFIDLSQDVLDPVIEALRQLHAPLGVYLVPGNHDYLENGPKLVRKFRNAGLNLLVNKTAVVNYQGSDITIAGVDYAHQRSERAFLVQRMMARTLRQGRTPLTILLAHHPDSFDEARKWGVDVTLSGHTHGGQVILKHTEGKRGSIGLGAMAFRYPRGLYHHGQRHLHVTSGVGSWFPLRVKCPSEIVSLTLRTKD